MRILVNNDYEMLRNILNVSVIDMLRSIRKLPEQFSLGSFFIIKNSIKI